MGHVDRQMNSLHAQQTSYRGALSHLKKELVSHFRLNYINPKWCESPLSVVVTVLNVTKTVLLTQVNLVMTS